MISYTHFVGFILLKSLLLYFVFSNVPEFQRNVGVTTTKLEVQENDEINNIEKSLLSENLQLVDNSEIFMNARIIDKEFNSDVSSIGNFITEEDYTDESGTTPLEEIMGELPITTDYFAESVSKDSVIDFTTASIVNSSVEDVEVILDDSLELSNDSVIIDFNTPSIGNSSMESLELSNDSVIDYPTPSIVNSSIEMVPDDSLEISNKSVIHYATPSIVNFSTPAIVNFSNEDLQMLSEDILEDPEGNTVPSTLSISASSIDHRISKYITAPKKIKDRGVLSDELKDFFNLEWGGIPNLKVNLSEIPEYMWTVYSSLNGSEPDRIMDDTVDAIISYTEKITFIPGYFMFNVSSNLDVGEADNFHAELRIFR